MFTGIVTGIGRVVCFERRRGGAGLSVAPPPRYGRFERGESVSVSGVCLTATSAGPLLETDLSLETLARTTLGTLASGDTVNLERALRFGDRLSGHFVLGHVDGVAKLLDAKSAGKSWVFRFSAPSRLSRFIVRKGSVTLDGISLTVAVRRARDFDVAVIPETRRRTTLSLRQPGDELNLEVDVFARYGKARSLRLLRA
jgi:riboflavin synthase